jgi:hypothetical protein
MNRNRQEFWSIPIFYFLMFSVCCGMLGSKAAAQKYVFGRADFGVGTMPWSVAIGDFNGDGKLDLAVVNQADNTVSILLGKQDGTFARKVDYATGAGPVSVATGDFNRDRKLDLAVVNSSDDTVSILRGNGDGTFAPQATFLTAVNPQMVIVRDINADGKLDLAIAAVDLPAGLCCGPGSVSILLGNGDGTFQAHVDYGVGSSPAGLTQGDFNGDGKLDLAVANQGDNTVSVLIGNGDGTFRTHVDYAVGTSPISVATGDFNRDKKTDLAVANSQNGSGGTVSVLLGNGDGTFQTHVDYATGADPAAVISVDLNGDGKLDLVLAGRDSLSVLLGKGDGTFASHVDYGPEELRSVAAADFNGDGKIDLAVPIFNCNINPCPPGSVAVLLGNGDGTFPNHVDYATGTGPGLPATADFKNDGILDLAIANGFDNTISILLGNGNGTFRAHVDYPTGVGPRGTAVGDFNGDGKLDLAVTNYGSLSGKTVSILLGKGDGTFLPHVDYSTGFGPISVVAGDFNRDGNLDLAIANQNCPGGGCSPGTVSILLGNGDGTFKPHVDYVVALSPTSLTTGDFNGDGYLDLAVAGDFNDTVSVLLGKGDGTFLTHVDYPTGHMPLSIAAGDLRGIGKLDLATANFGANTVSVLLGKGDGTFITNVDYNTGSEPTSVIAGDLNGDGKLDLAVGAGIGVSLFLGNGDGTFQPRADFLLSPLAGAPAGLVAGDFNRDGGLDLAGAATTNKTASVLLNSTEIALFPTRLPFGKQIISTTSAAKSILLSNPGSVPLKVSSVTLTGSDTADFVEANTCLGKISVGSGCTTSAKFSPQALGTRSATIGISDNSPGRRQFIGLIGTGVLPAPLLSPTRLSYGDQLVGVSSPPKNVKLTNTGKLSLTITSIKVTGANGSDFVISSNSCDSSLAAGADCTVAVTFKPTATGNEIAAVVLTDNSINSPQRVSLTGTGTVVRLVPGSLNFGGQKVGTSSASKAVAVTNTGKTILTITSISITGTNSGDFYISANTCASRLGPGASCSINVKFKPTATGERSASLTFFDDGGGSPQDVSLTGTGT